MDTLGNPAQQSVNSTNRSHHKNKKSSLVIGESKKDRLWRIAAITSMLLITVLAFGYISARHDLKTANNKAEVAKIEKQELIKKVSLLVDLPANEEPSTATVSDVSKLNSQAFFLRAQNGDKVLVYVKSGRAVIYRPSTNRVIEYSSVSLPSS